jgi:serine/threonine-protein kinase
MTGQTLGSYRVGEKLGEGGMGVVYRAHDTKLGRDVAIKVLPEAFARDPERLARFEREARTLAALNHPNVAHVYGIEQGALVMELVEGPSLADRLKSGAIPLDQAIDIARQIAAGLEAAHERGITHRDLKPANIKITPEGQVKLLDFGLAKAMESKPVPTSDPENSPTLTAAMSGVGVILGTAGYMAPEQARGGRVDHRADVWAFGVVFYEMVTGRRLFQGETVSDTLAAVLAKDVDIDGAPARTRAMLCRCLDRDVHKRLGWIGEARRLLEELPESGGRISWRWLIPVMAAMALAAGFAGWLMRTPPASRDQPPVAFSFTPEALDTRDYVRRAVISPNSRQIAFVAENKLWIRDMASERARAIEGSENAEGPFWSPDSTQIAFATGRDLKKVPVAGGMPFAFATLPSEYRGGTWGPDGQTIVVSTVGAGLSEVPVNGGALRTVASPHPSGSYYSPQFVPSSNQSRLILAGMGNRAVQSVLLVDLKTGQSQILREQGAYPAWFPSGHIVFQTNARAPGLWAMRLSPSTGKVSGEPVAVLSSGSDFSASSEGTLTWIDAPGLGERRLVWRDRSGAKLGDAGSPHATLTTVALSPDGKKVAYSAAEQNHPDVWILDLERMVRTRLTFAPQNDAFPVWTPSGKEIVFTSFERSGDGDLYIQSADGTGEPRPVIAGPTSDFSHDWSPDGATLLFVRRDSKSGNDLWTIRRKSTGEFEQASPWLATPFTDHSPRFSPDGRYVLYESNESGRFEVYIRPFAGGGRRQISSGGGADARWRRDGKEIFYIRGNALIAVPVSTGAGPLTSGAPVELFRSAGLDTSLSRPYEVAPDGKRFLISEPVGSEHSKPPAIHVILNWPVLLKQKAGSE